MKELQKSIILPKKSLHTDIFTTLRDRIVCMSYPPGTQLNEKALCAEFGVSRTPLREAIRKLEDLNLVTVIPRFGTHVSAIDLEELQCALQVQVKLDGLAAELAARNRSSHMLKELDRLLELFNQKTADKDSVQASLIAIESSLHSAIWSAAQNPLLESFLNNIQHRCARVWNSVLLKTIKPREVSEQLTVIVEAIRRQDEQPAAMAAEKHVRYFIERLTKNLI